MNLLSWTNSFMVILFVGISSAPSADGAALASPEPKFRKPKVKKITKLFRHNPALRENVAHQRTLINSQAAISPIDMGKSTATNNKATKQNTGKESDSIEKSNSDSNPIKSGLKDALENLPSQTSQSLAQRISQSINGESSSVLENSQSPNLTENSALENGSGGEMSGDGNSQV